MFVAQKKKEENIIEYVLYMWQIEDLIRSCNFDVKILSKTVIEKSPYSEAQKQELHEWYLDLMHQLEREGKTESGHLNFMSDIVDDLIKVHDFLIKIKQNQHYYKHYLKVAPLIDELQKNQQENTPDITCCLEFIYGYLLLRLQQKEVRQKTMQALQTITSFCYELAENYKDYKQGYLNLSDAQKN